MILLSSRCHRTEVRIHIWHRCKSSWNGHWESNTKQQDGEHHLGLWQGNKRKAMSWLQTMAFFDGKQNHRTKPIQFLGKLYFCTNLFRQGVFQVPKIGEKSTCLWRCRQHWIPTPNFDTSKRSIDSTAPEAPFDDSSSIAQANPPTSPHMKSPLLPVVWRRIPIGNSKNPRVQNPQPAVVRWQRLINCGCSLPHHLAMHLGDFTVGWRITSALHLSNCSSFKESICRTPTNKGCLQGKVQTQQHLRKFQRTFKTFRKNPSKMHHVQISTRPFGGSI